MQFSIKLEGVDDVIRNLKLSQRKIEIATQRALIKTANYIREAEQAEMQRVFDRPTRWTLGSMKVKPTGLMEVTVGILDPDGYYKRANYYLGTQVSGGNRKTKAFERALQRMGVMPQGWHAVPGQGAKIDAYGNQSPGEIKQILSWFNAAEPYSGSTQNMTTATRDKRRKGSKKAYGFEYFYAAPGSRVGKRSWREGKFQHLYPGIYRRIFTGFGKAIKPIIIFVPGTKYQPRFNFEMVARKTADKHLNAEFNAAIKIELDKIK